MSDRCPCNTFPRGCDNPGCTESRMTVIPAGAEPGPREKGAWVKLTAEELRCLRGHLPVGLGGIFHRLDSKFADAQKGLP